MSAVGLGLEAKAKVLRATPALTTLRERQTSSKVASSSTSLAKLSSDTPNFYVAEQEFGVNHR
jgi:hypothetical protein